MRTILILLVLLLHANARLYFPVSKDLGDIEFAASADIVIDKHWGPGELPDQQVRRYLYIQIDSKTRVRILWSITSRSASREGDILPAPLNLVVGKRYQFTVAQFYDTKGFRHWYVKAIEDGTTLLLNTRPIEFPRFDAEIAS